ncbi:MAG: glycosyltransferase [Humibacter sp.]
MAAEGDPVSVSVCMATYNGARFVEEQLRSILEQLPADGEVVVVDDASTDDTVAVVTAIGDPRIRVSVHETNQGYVATFGEALQRAGGSALLLSDQDDVWTPGRLGTLVDALQHDDVVASNLALYPDHRPLPTPFGGPDWRLSASTSTHGVRNSLGVLAGAMPYFGCAMAMSARARDWIVPFPAFLTESHDLWIALCGNAGGTMRHLDEVTVLRRLHDTNASPSRPRGPGSVLKARWMLVRAILVAGHRARRRRSAA